MHRRRLSRVDAVIMLGALLVVLVTAIAITSVASAKPSPGSNCHSGKTCTPSPSPTPTTTSPSPTPTTTPPPAGHKVMVIMEENHDRDQAMAGMPHLASWASTYGQANNYIEVGSPSLPNYLAIFGGSTFGISDDNDPSAHPLSGASVFGQTLAAGGTAKAYAEDMPANCDLTDSRSYAVRHGGWAYFVDERTQCNAFDVPMGTTSSGNLLNDINAGPCRPPAR